MCVKGENMSDKKKLVAYFSASGVTRSVAKTLAKVADADIFEIVPEVPYTNADLNWMDKKARSTIEMHDKAYRPAIAEKLESIDEYDVILVGFPIWWYVAPTIVNTFLENFDFSGKTIILFATSGGSKFGNTLAELKISCSSATKIMEGKVFTGRSSEEELSDWFAGLKI